MSEAPNPYFPVITRPVVCCQEMAEDIARNRESDGFVCLDGKEFALHHEHFYALMGIRFCPFCGKALQQASQQPIQPTTSAG